MGRNQKSSIFYVAVEKTEKECFIFKDKGAIAAFLDISRYKFSKIIEKGYDCVGDFEVFVCKNAQIKSNSGGNRR